MLKQQQRSCERASVVVSPMDDDGRMELRDVEADETYEVVDYIDSELATKLRSLSAGEAVNLELLSGSESGVFGAVRIESSGPSARFQ
ncbi:hypothetical protein BDK61_3222 [Haloarcula quadrata]|jgi:hypothetical protein|uniref:DUF7999 domain-containing protein n=5 Tax=Haloarcula TaxID=2237 RepID=Q5UX19_HALMA|nr:MULTISPECIES: hypothetical protein [Haloarcula]AAV48184.1 unknown [Haloarcula marismortui ATCC 43049]AJF26313.1 hypothetical protein SG26_11515 [Haloarcula sp. CBA1115]EMA12712.1 hypothetical protein C436_13195 [Haloarcula sinaiiensis ATCC 33800]EMA21736.1 hypothetical protein C435_03888 [Haloarcula californiae ATCC 33799]KAA9409083.1 hypothetical protein EGO51_04500 [Haloarcula hispanica]